MKIFKLLKLTGCKVEVMKLDLSKLREEIKKFREKLDNADGTHVHWAHTSINDFEDKENYPLDFQIFMEEIGSAYLASEPDGNGYQILMLCEPSKADELTESFYEDSFITSSKDQYSGVFYERDGISYFAKDVSLIARDVDAQYYGFIKTKKPYEFFSSWNGSTKGVPFWNWFKKYISDAIEYNNPGFKID